MKGTAMKKNSDLVSTLHKNQRGVLRDLREQLNDLNGVLEMIAVSQDVDAIRKEHMDFLGIVGSRTLSGKELEQAKEGISFDDLRRMVGCKVEAAAGRESFKASLDQGHIIRMIFAEHDFILYYLCDLETSLGQLHDIADWKQNPRMIEKIAFIVKNLCTLDPHRTREEQVIIPQLRSYGYDDIPEIICAEHVRIRKDRLELQTLAESIDKMPMEKWVGRLEAVAGSFVPLVRSHIRKEEIILYPNAIKVIQDPSKWAAMKAQCDEIIMCGAGK
jgi:DUF438 domain-containing protein